MFNQISQPRLNLTRPRLSLSRSRLRTWAKNFYPDLPINTWPPPTFKGLFGSFISSAVTLLHSELLQHLQGTSRRNQTCLTCVQRFGSTLKFRLLVLSHLKLKVCCNQSVTALTCNQIVNKDIQSGRRLSLKPNHYKIAVVYCFFTIICL